MNRAGKDGCLSERQGVNRPCRLRVAGQVRETKVIKNDLNPTWGEAFDFPVGAEKVLTLTLLDWERLGKPRPIGAVAVPVRWLRESGGQNGLFALKAPDGSPVTGKDGQPAALHLEMRYEADEAARAADPRARQLEALVDSARADLARLTGAPPPPPAATAPAAAAGAAGSGAGRLGGGGLLPWRLKVWGMMADTDRGASSDFNDWGSTVQPAC